MYTVYVNEIEDEELKKEVKEFISDDDVFSVYLDGRDWIVVEGKTQKYELDVWKLDPGRKNIFKRLQELFEEKIYELQG